MAMRASSPAATLISLIDMARFSSIVAGSGDVRSKITRRRHRHNVEAGIDEMDFPRDARAHVAEEVERGVADVLQLHRHLERAMMLVPAEDGARLADHRAGQRAHRTGAD